MSHKKLTIKSWSLDDRPREKLISKGAKSLSNTELIAILIGSGNNKQSAVDLSKHILSQCVDKLSVLSKMTINDLNHEQFWIMLLSRSKSILHFTKISQGGLNAILGDPKLIFSTALQWKASGLILFHNHPSGNLQASESDKN